MPLAYDYDPPSGLLTVALCDRRPRFEMAEHVRRLLADPALPPSAPVLVTARALRSPPEGDDLDELSGHLHQLRGRFGRRVAVATTAVGTATTAQLIVLLTGPAAHFAAFTSDGAARRWLLDPTG